MGVRGAYILICVTLALWFSVFALYRVLNDPLGNVPLSVEKKVVPATGEKGFPVEPFACDSKTDITQQIVGPDTKYKAIYMLVRKTDAITEVVTVRVYPDPNREPDATYKDDVTPAYVTPAAMKCILKGVK